MVGVTMGTAGQELAAIFGNSRKICTGRSENDTFCRRKRATAGEIAQFLVAGGAATL
jgi:hypothetical protein